MPVPVPSSRICCFLTLLFFTGGLWGQTKPFRAYSQSIPGTELSIRMLPIPGGTFSMGSPASEPGHRPDEGPVNEVKIDPFWMAEVEISWDLYNLFVDRVIDAQQPQPVAGTEVQLDADAVTGATRPYVDMTFSMGREGYPAISMTQLAASRFCAWLSALTGNFYRLPTEAEWEYACRAGTQSAYAYGEDPSLLGDYAWFGLNSRDRYQKVGQKKPNAWGLYDMHGNVAEWTVDQYVADAYASYRSGQSDNPVTLPKTTYPRTVRGGSWQDDAQSLRCAARRPSDKKWKQRDPQIPKSKWWHTDAPFVGFRIVRPVNTPSPKEKKVYWGYSD